MTLLYVEDCPQTRRTTSFIFQNFFNQVIVATDGEEGFCKFQKNQIDIIITDIDMPNLNGIDMIKKIRAINSDVVIVVISAYNSTNYLTESIKYQVQDYLFKPITRKQFREMFSKVYKQIVEKKKEERRKRLLEEYKALTDESSIISKTDIYGNIIYVNDKFCELYGYTREELLGQCHDIIISPNDSKEKFVKLWKSFIVNKKSWEGLIQDQTKNGEMCYAKTTIKPILNIYGEVEELMVLKTLITDFIHSKKQLTDFLSTVDESMVILMQIEDFHYLETSLGNEISENIQKEFVEKLFDFQSKKCKVSKIYFLEHGKFIFIKKMSSSKHIDILIKELKVFQKEVNQAKVNIEPIEYDLSIIISLGYGTHAFENAKIGLENLLEFKQNFIVANELIEEKKFRAISQIETFKMLKKAIDSYNVLSYFQPIVNNKTKKVEKYESLVRIMNENGEILSPEFFLDRAKEGTYYNQITSLVLSNSFQALSKTNKGISINFSALDIENKQSRKKLLELLEEHKDASHRITIELLEDENIKDMELIKSFIRDVKYYGVTIAIDDFGVGYSNFQRVMEFEPDILKIDGSLIKNIEHDKFSLNMVETIVAFSQKQKIKTIAEFVENETIYNIVHTLGVDYSQGYYFGKPDVLYSI